MTFDPFKGLDAEAIESLREAVRQAGIDMEKYRPYKEKKMERVYEVGARVTYYFPGDDEHGVAGTVIGFHGDRGEVRYQIKWDKGPGSVEPEAYLRREQKKKPEFKEGDRIRLLNVNDGLPGTFKGKEGVIVGTNPDKTYGDRWSVEVIGERGSHTRDGKQCWFVSEENMEKIVGKKTVIMVGTRVVRSGRHFIHEIDYGERESKIGTLGVVTNVKSRPLSYCVDWDTGRSSEVNPEAITALDDYEKYDWRDPRGEPIPVPKTMVSVPKDMFDLVVKDFDLVVKDRDEAKSENKELKESLKIAREAIAQARRERDAVVATLAAMKARGFDKILADMEEEEQVIPS